MKPSSSEAAQSMALSIDSPPWVQWAIILVIVACAKIWLPMRVGAGAPEIEAITIAARRIVVEGARGRPLFLPGLEIVQFFERRDVVAMARGHQLLDRGALG